MENKKISHEEREKKALSGGLMLFDSGARARLAGRDDFGGFRLAEGASFPGARFWRRGLQL